MRYGLSEKQLALLSFGYTDYDAVIADGAVRSGKTSLMTVGFIEWAMGNFSGCTFGICGKTIESAYKNIILPYLSLSFAKSRYRLSYSRGDNILEVRRGSVTNRFEVFGGRDETSYMQIQGRTLAGVMLDEVALMPRSFVEQALARCSCDGAKFWFSCNPESPRHWFYQEWIQRANLRNALYLHFLMQDNPSLSQKVLERYARTYSGVFYRRYILGEWVLAEGLVYSLPETAVVERCLPLGEYYIAIDYGTQNPFSAGLYALKDGVATRFAEYYHEGREKGQLTDEDYCDAVEALAGFLPIRAVVVDPSATSFITALKRRHKFHIRKAKNELLDGIRWVSTLLQTDRLKITENCKSALDEFYLYRWEPDTDRPIKQNDHAMDEIRYFCNTIIKR